MQCRLKTSLELKEPRRLERFELYTLSIYLGCIDVIPTIKLREFIYRPFSTLRTRVHGGPQGRKSSADKLTEFFGWTDIYTP